MFDHPEKLGLTYILFLLINSYPLALVGNMFLSLKIFRKIKLAAVILPLLPCAFLLYLVAQIAKG